MSTTTDREYLTAAATAAHAKLPDGAGFILLTAYESDGRVRYISNVDRAEAIKLLKEFLFRNDAEENWMKNIN